MDVMQTIKTSRLQKRILTLIYLKGKCEEVVDIVDWSNPAKVNAEYQLEKQKLVDERGGQLLQEYQDSEGLLVRSYRITAYRLNRRKLACMLFSWQKLNYCLEISNEARLKAEPEGYHARQTALTNSLKSLKTKGLAEFFDYYREPLWELKKKQARVIWLTTEGIKKAEAILTIKLKKSGLNLTVRIKKEGGEQYEQVYA